jgi:hypothetical protein
MAGASFEKMKSPLCAWLFICALVQAGAAASQPLGNALPVLQNTSSAENPMVTDETMFKSVVNTQGPNPCSPKDPGPAWRGILIRAPKQVSLTPVSGDSPAIIIPVCGYYMLEVLSLLDSAQQMKMIAKNLKSGRVYQGDVIDRDPSPEIPPPDDKPLDPATLLPGLAIGAYFNKNLAEYVNLPRAPAIYEVYVEYGGLQSNKAIIELINKP